MDAEKLAGALEVNTAISTLYLNYNSIGDIGCAALAEAMKGNTVVRGLYLSNTAAAMQAERQ